MVSIVMKKKILAFALIAFALVLSSFKEQAPVTVFMIGDSTMANKPYKDGNPEKGWGQVFGLYFNEQVKVDNHAVNGRSSLSFLGEHRWEPILKKLQPGDYVIIQFGHNDQKKDEARHTEPEEGYRANYIKYIEEARAKGAIPIVATPIVRRRFDENGTFYGTHGNYPDAVRKLAKDFDVPLLDLHSKSMQLVKDFGEIRSKQLYLHLTAGEYASLPEGREDDTHLSAYGAFKIADLAVAEIKENVPALAEFLKK